MSVLRKFNVTFFTIVIISMFCLLARVDLSNWCSVTTYAGADNASPEATAAEVTDMLVSRWEMTGIEGRGHPLEEVPRGSMFYVFQHDGAFAMNCTFGSATWHLIDGDEAIEIKLSESETIVWIINAINAQTLVLEEGGDLFHLRRVEDCTNISNFRQMEMITLTGSVVRGNSQPIAPNKYGIYGATFTIFLNDAGDNTNNPWGGVQTGIGKNGDFEVYLVMSSDVEILAAEVYNSDGVQLGSFKFRMSSDHLSIGEIISTSGDIIVSVKVKGKEKWEQK